MSDLFPVQSEVFMLKGHLQRFDAEDRSIGWTREECEAFWTEFLELVIKHNALFGGAFGGISAEDIEVLE